MSSTSSTKKVSYKKAQRYKEWKSKTARLRALRKKQDEDRVMQKNPSDGIVFINFVPSGHGFNFMPNVYKDMLKNDGEMDLDEWSESARKRKCSEDTTKEQMKPLPWFTRYLSERERLEQSYKDSFKR